jgi:hypothetical protein
MDGETGLVYYGMRYYLPQLGRFISRDPIEELGGVNLYAFCGNDGTNRFDYLGMNFWDWITGGGQKKSQEEQDAERARQKAEEEARKRAIDETGDPFGVVVLGRANGYIDHFGQVAYDAALGNFGGSATAEQVGAIQGAIAIGRFDKVAEYAMGTLGKAGASPLIAPNNGAAAANGPDWYNPFSWNWTRIGSAVEVKGGLGVGLDVRAKISKLEVGAGARVTTVGGWFNLGGGKGGYQSANADLLRIKAGDAQFGLGISKETKFGYDENGRAFLNDPPANKLLGWEYKSASGDSDDWFKVGASGKALFVEGGVSIDFKRIYQGIFGGGGGP